MLKIAICDDERAQRDYLTALVGKWSGACGAPVNILNFESAESFLFDYQEHMAADILLLDIQMKGLDGIELARKIRQDNSTVQIVFVTGYADFIAEGYDVSALHYLMKPVKEEKLFEVLDKAVSRLQSEESILLAETAEGVVRVLQRDILYIEAFAHSVVIENMSQ